MKEEYIRDEYYRAEVHYQAMKALAEKEGININDDVKPDPAPAPAPDPTPAPEPVPTPAPASKDPEIVYTGAKEIVLSASEETKFSVFVNNVSSTKDYTIEPYGNPTYYKYHETTYPTDTGYRLDFELKGTDNAGNGLIKVYLTANRNKIVSINIKCKGA